MGNKRVHLIVEGVVQGVNFRNFTRAAALKEHVTGWVKNLPDGSVEAVLEGAVQAVDRLVEVIRRGPAAGRVERLELKTEPATGEFSTFEVLRRIR